MRVEHRTPHNDGTVSKGELTHCISVEIVFIERAALGVGTGNGNGNPIWVAELKCIAKVG